MADGVLEHLTAGGGTHRVSSTAFAYSNTAAGTAAKTATIYKANNTSGTAASGFTLVDGVQVAVYFVNGNTAANVTLNINSTGAKPVYLNGTERTNAYVSHGWKAGSIVTFIYNTRSNSSGCWTILADNTSWSRQVQIDTTSSTQHGLIVGSEFAHTPNSAIPTESVGPLTIAGQAWYNEQNGSPTMTLLDSPTNTSIRYTGTEIVRNASSRSTSIQFETPSDNRVITVPNASGTLALTSDISGKIDTAGTGLSKSGTTLNHSNSVTAQTTQALYPIKIDAQGHISEYGSAVTLPTDTKVTQTPISSSSLSKAVLLSSGDGTSETTNSTNVYKGLYFSPYDEAEPRLYIDDGAASNAKSGHYSYDHLTLGNSSNANSTTVSAGNVSSNVSIALPTSSGTLALKSDVVDEKVASSTVVNSSVYSLLVGSNTNTASKVFRDSGNFEYVSQNQNTAQNLEGLSLVRIGNDTPAGTAGNRRGLIHLYDTGTYHVELRTTDSMTNSHTIYFPDATGTLALTSDVTNKIDTAGTGLSKSGTTLNHSNSTTAKTTQAVYPITFDAQGHITGSGSAATIPSVTLNGSSNTSPSFYAPTGAGTSGQYLKSSGTGAPTWANFPTIPSITLNGSSSTSPSFYAPTTAGTSGYYLKSSGSGAPTWASFPTITDNKVAQDPVSTDANYEILFSGTADNTSKTEGAGKTSSLLFNPSSQKLTVGASSYTQRITASSNSIVGHAGFEDYISEVSGNYFGQLNKGVLRLRYNSLGTAGDLAINAASSLSATCQGVMISGNNDVDYLGTGNYNVPNFANVTAGSELTATHLIIKNSSGSTQFDRTGLTINDGVYDHKVTATKIDNWDVAFRTAGTGLSNSGTTINHSNSVSAQTTQAVYPIKIDAQGHISAYGSAVTNIVRTTTTQTLSNKTLTSPTISSGLVFDSSIGSDLTMSGFKDSLQSATGTYSLDSGSIYLVIVKRMNNSSAGGLYIVAPHSTTGSITEITAATGASVSISKTTLTVTASVNNIYVRAIKLA